MQHDLKIKFFLVIDLFLKEAGPGQPQYYEFFFKKKLNSIFSFIYFFSSGTALDSDFGSEYWNCKLRVRDLLL